MGQELLGSTLGTGGQRHASIETLEHFEKQITVCKSLYSILENLNKNI